jgi:hypothetical protein
MDNTEAKKLIAKSKRVIDELLEITHPLVEQYPNGKTHFLKIFVGVYRRANHNFQAIRCLAEKNHLASPSYILTRSLIEDVIAIEYMLITDREAKAKKFQDYEWIQSLDDATYFQEHHIEEDDPDIKLAIEKIRSNADSVKQPFIYNKKTGELNKSWDGLQVDGMLEKIIKDNPKDFAERDRKLITRAYLIGNRKTHFNPIDIRTYLSQDSVNMDYVQSMQESLIIAFACYVRLTTRYIDAISHDAGKNLYDDIAHKAVELLKSMDSAN